MPWGNMIAVMGAMAQVCQQCAKGQGCDNSTNSFNSFAEAAQRFEPKTPARDTKSIPLQLGDLRGKPGQQAALPVLDQVGSASTAPAENSPAKLDGGKQAEDELQTAAANGKANIEEQLFQTLKDKKKLLLPEPELPIARALAKGEVLALG